tara:strand:- start:300 stop:680 length:381 start_codon:yes stop_codon:yes gene_type:complete
MTKLINISQLSKELNLIDKKNNKPANYILRYWEKEFKQIKPKLVNNRRYYTKETVELIKLIKFLLKDKGLTIKGVKNVLKSDINELDDYNSDSLKTSYYKHNFKSKSLKILNKLKKLKKNGKKNTY